MSENQEQTKRKVLICDPDQASVATAVNIIKEIGGFDEPVIAEDGHQTWDKAASESFDLFVIDWKMTILSGLKFFNRLRAQENTRYTPVIILSSSMQQEDFALLEEYPCAVLVEKPIVRTNFEKKLESIIKEYVWYTQQEMVLKTLIKLLNERKSEALESLKKMLTEAPNPIPLALLTSRVLREQGDFGDSEKILRKILEAYPDNLLANGEIGKVMLHQGKIEEAKEFLTKASKISPKNMQRILDIGEAELQLGDLAAAKARFEEALEIDGDSARANAGILITDNLNQHIFDYQKSLKSVGSFLGLLNALGISLVRSKQFQKGVDQYNAALQFAHTKTASARIVFNLALAYMRWNKKEEARKYFEESLSLSDGTFKKCLKYLDDDTQKAVKGAVPISEGSSEDEILEAPSNVIHLPKKDINVQENQEDAEIKTDADIVHI